jgi:hypothetical protein
MKTLGIGRLRAALALACLAAAALTSPAEARHRREEKVYEIVVTGTRIATDTEVNRERELVGKSISSAGLTGTFDTRVNRIDTIQLVHKPSGFHGLIWIGDNLQLDEKGFTTYAAGFSESLSIEREREGFDLDSAFRSLSRPIEAITWRRLSDWENVEIEGRSVPVRGACYASFEKDRQICVYVAAFKGWVASGTFTEDGRSGFALIELYSELRELMGLK